MWGEEIVRIMVVVVKRWWIGDGMGVSVEEGRDGMEVDGSG